MDIKKDLLKEILMPITKLVKNEINQILSNKLLEFKISQYKRIANTKTILHRGKPVKLIDIYHPVKITSPEKPLDKHKILNIDDLFKETRFVTIIGEAGAGKSTFLNYLYILAFNQNKKYPIFIELRSLNTYKGSFEEYIKLEIFSQYKLSLDDSITDRLLESNKFIFFLDGYDELLVKNKTKVTRELGQFINKYINNFFIISSRPYANAETIPLFSNYRLSELEKDEIPEFISKQFFGKQSELVTNIINSIQTIENKYYYEFVKNPLLLSMYILTFQNYSKLPSLKSTFYQNVFDALFYTHDSISKGGFAREKISGLSKEEFEEILRRFSIISFFEEKFSFEQLYLEKTLDNIKLKKGDINFDNQKFIQDLKIAIGILRKEGNEYLFPHRSLQEFFAAVFISRLEKSKKNKIYKKLRVKLFSKSKKINELINFYQILVEIDYKSSMELFVIPTLKSLYNFEFSHTWNYDKFILGFYEISGVISLIGRNDLNNSIYFSEYGLIEPTIDLVNHHQNRFKVLKEELKSLRIRHRNLKKERDLLEKGKRKLKKEKRKELKLKDTHIEDYIPPNLRKELSDIQLNPREPSFDLNLIDVSSKIESKDKEKLKIEETLDRSILSSLGKIKIFFRESKKYSEYKVPLIISTLNIRDKEDESLLDLI